MARAQTKTLLTLDRFAQLVGLHPLHFNQVAVVDLAPVSTCDSPILQYSWQDADRIGREEIAETIAMVEDQLQELLGFPVGRTWLADERVQFPKYNDPSKFSTPYNPRWEGVSLRLKNGNVISGGKETKTLISAGVAITYSDEDSDTYFETATISVATTVTEISEIALYYPGHSGEDAFEIRPITVSIAGGTATIVCRREQLVLSSLQEALQTAAVDGLDDGSFLATVDVYRHWTDPSEQITFLWEDPYCNCGEVGCASCQFLTQEGCLKTRNPELGLVVPSPGGWDADTETFTVSTWAVARTPTQARVWYRAGAAIGTWERTIALLTLSLLDRPLCACKTFEAQMSFWREDFAYQRSSQGGSHRWNVSSKILNNPIGTTRAAIRAWNQVFRASVL